MARAACLAPGESIPHHLLTLTLHLPEDDFEAPLQAEDGLRRLVELGLIRTEERGAVRLHRLIVTFIRDVVVGEALGKAQAEVEVAVCEEAERINERVDPRPLLGWQPHLRFVTQATLTREDLVTAKLCNELGWHLWQTGDFVGSRSYFEQALTIRQCLLGEEHPDTAHSLDRLGFLLRAQGKLDEAGPCFERALAIREKVLGEMHRDTAISLNEVGRWWHLQGNFVTARQHYERALRVNRAVLGEDHPLTAEYLNNIGASLLEAGDLDEALPYLKQALAVNEKVFGPEHPGSKVRLSHTG